ncbi:DUF1793-domain-containing protein [Daedalea quercina L-15889]|uniref:DUF1793-domain-containing protein n=1 Tax=Daedalea quercina L-15889 TaxID=1314783 RepID=A0A165S347_9APHY|nr:DUF1793-domain-containing protein [Daedalea quercina L-15889]
MSAGIFIIAVSLFSTSARCAINWTATPFNPPSVPLAIRSPYLSAWLPQWADTGGSLSGNWPRFWQGDTLGWAGFVNVDGESYNFLGAPSVPNTGFNTAVQHALQWTSTQSMFNMTAGPVNLTVTFLSPIEPSNLINQSVPFSYMSVQAVSNDGDGHSVQVYSDISAEWVSGTDSSLVNWTTAAQGDTVIHKVQLQQQTLFDDSGDRIQQGAAYYATGDSANMTFQTGQDVVVRGQFINHGVLLNTQDTDFRAISDDWPVFAFAHDLGTVPASGESDIVVFSVGHARDPVINYTLGLGRSQQRHPYFLCQYPTVEDAIQAFAGDYTNALTRANALDAQIHDDASAISSNYSAIVALVLRQTFGAIEFSISTGSDGQYNDSDVTVFLKEISSDGDTSTTDVIFPAWPTFLYTNPLIGKQLLLPLFEYQATGEYPNKTAAHDLGHYPQAPGYPLGNDESMPIEECGNMLIMTLSYTQRTNDTSLVTSYYGLLDQWAQYLVANTLIPGDQLSTNDIAGPLANQTNLAIKGIIGIQAMSEMAALAGNTSAAANYSGIASSYVSQWLELATASDGQHLTLAYGNDSSYGITYNMYADKLLGTNIIPQSVFDMQSTWYENNHNAYGVPLDTRHLYVMTAWEMLTAAMVNTAARNLLIDAIYAFSSSGLNHYAYSDWFDTTTGIVEGNCGGAATLCFRARPIAGAHLALLALPND